MSTWSHGLLNLLICVGLLVVMPLGLRLLAVPGVAGVHRLWFVAATPAAISVWLPRGWLAAVFATAYLPATAVLLVAAGRVLLSSHLPRPHATATAHLPATAGLTASAGLPRPHATATTHPPATAALTVSAGPAFPGRVRSPSRPRSAAPTVAGCALVAERAGYRLFGFDLDVLALTVAHFHYAGFAAALIAGLVCEVDGDGPAGRFAALSVPAGIAVVFAGFFTTSGSELKDRPAAYGS